MKRAVVTMIFSLERVRRYLFFLTIFALPWQTRWFQEGPSLGGFSWEQGRISLYVSWILIFLGAMLTGIHHLLRSKEQKESEQVLEKKTRLQERIMLIVGFLFVFASSVHSVSLRATGQWAMQWFILVLFVWTVWDLRPRFVDMARVFLISLVPSILIGIWQYYSQVVHGIKWFGIAAQNPMTPGVSVIATGSDRILRIYGIFPHPNIFAAWLVVGILTALLLLLLTKKQFENVLVFFFLLVSSIVLLLTFSRAAVIALIAGAIIFLSRSSVRQLIHVYPPRELVAEICVFVLLAGAVFFQTRSMWFVRVTTNTRLEQRSVDERTEALQDGLTIFRTSPWLGVGPGAVLVAVEKCRLAIPRPPVPPHFVPLVMLDELGIVGMLGLILLGLSKRRWIRDLRLFKAGSEQPIIFPLGASLLGALFVLGLFDHYLWTLWSGMVLFSILLIIISCLKRTDSSEN